MKNILILAGLCTVMASCADSRQTTENQDTVAASDMAAATRQTEVDTNINDLGTNRNAGSEPSGSFARGAKLISESDCLSCHKENERIIGPSYVEVAEKYEATDKNTDYLAGKIITGGSGVWGDVPMTPHPSIGEDDAKEMARYILSLK